MSFISELRNYAKISRYKWNYITKGKRSEGFWLIENIEKNDTIFVRSFTDERIENVVENGIEYLDGEDDIEL